MQKAIEYFQQAIQVDPLYAPAYTGLADAYSVLGAYALRAPKDMFPLAKAMVEKAFEIEGELAEAHTSLALIRLAYDYDFAAAERECKRALELNPGHAIAHQYLSYCWTVTGRMDEALREINRALELDPLSPTVNAAAGRALFYARQYEASVEQLEKTIELDPHLPLGHCYLGMTYMAQEKYKEALGALEKALEISGESPWVTVHLGMVYGLMGERDKAMGLIREWEKRAFAAPMVVSGIYLGLGEDDKVFDWLERCYQEREFVLPWINTLPYYDRLRLDPRFQSLMRRLGLSK